MLIQQFRYDNYRLHQLGNNSVFTITLQAGLSAIKTPYPSLLCFMNILSYPVCTGTVTQVQCLSAFIIWSSTTFLLPSVDTCCALHCYQEWRCWCLNVTGAEQRQDKQTGGETSLLFGKLFCAILRFISEVKQAGASAFNMFSFNTNLPIDFINTELNVFVQYMSVRP